MTRQPDEQTDRLVRSWTILDAIASRIVQAAVAFLWARLSFFRPLRLVLSGNEGQRCPVNFKFPVIEQAAAHLDYDYD